jgi:hypothetical protein
VSVAASLLDDLTAIRRWSQRLPPTEMAEIDTINVIIGDGQNVLTTGIKAALHVDFNAFITGAYLHEFDGTTGSVSIGIAKAAYSVGSAPTFSSIVGSAPPTITSARYAEDETLTGWTTRINRQDVLRFSVSSVSAFTRLLIALRVRRLEP